MLTLLFILFIVFIVWPLVKVVLRVNQFKRQARDMFRQASSQASGQQQAQRKGGWTKATPRKKKIGGDVGEYVAFEEVASTSAQYTQTARPIASARTARCRMPSGRTSNSGQA